MSKTLTLAIADDIYEFVVKTARQAGQTPEAVIVDWVESKIRQATEDPLLQLVGIITADATNIGERHDDYLGENLRDNHE